MKPIIETLCVLALIRLAFCPIAATNHRPAWLGIVGASAVLVAACLA